MGKLEGKVAFVTGAARGQGRSHAVGLAQEGADILALDICAQIGSVPYPMSRPEDLEETVRLVEKTGRRIVPVQADVRDLAAMRSAVQACVAELGRIDVVVANAGILTSVGAGADEDGIFYDGIDVCLTGVWHTIRATLPVLKQQGSGGSIVLTSSTAGLKGSTSEWEAGTAAYVAAKHGVVGLMRTYANMLAPLKIRVNTVHPCGVNTPMVVNDVFAAFAQDHPDAAEHLRNPMPVELIEPADVTRAVVWLASDDARYVTGVTLPVDAGFCNRE